MVNYLIAICKELWVISVGLVRITEKRKASPRIFNKIFFVFSVFLYTFSNHERQGREVRFRGEGKFVIFD